MFNRLNNTYRLVTTFVLVLLLLLVTGCGGFSDDDYKRAGEEGVRELSIYNNAKLLGNEISIKSDVVKKVQDKYGRRIVVCRVKTKNKENFKFEDWTIFVVVAPYGNKLSWERIYPEITENIVAQFAEEIQSITKVYPWNFDPAEIEKKLAAEKKNEDNLTAQFAKCKDGFISLNKELVDWNKSIPYETISEKDLLKEFNKVTIKLVENFVKYDYDSSEKEYKKLHKWGKALHEEHEAAEKWRNANIALIQKPYEEYFLNFKGYVQYVSMIFNNAKHNVDDTLKILEKKPYSYAFEQEGDKYQIYVVNNMNVPLLDLKTKNPITVLHKGFRVKMFRQHGDVCQVQAEISGKEVNGWIAAKHLTEQKAWEKSTSFVEGNRDVYQDASSKNQMIPKEQNTQAVNYSNNSSKIKVGTITGDDVNVRKGPGADYTSLGFFYKGDKVRIVDSNRNAHNETWYKIEFDNPKVGLIVGWVRSDFINLN